MKFIFGSSDIYAHVVGRHEHCWQDHPEDVISVHESSHKVCGFTEHKRGDCGYPDKLFCRNPSHAITCKENETHGVL